MMLPLARRAGYSRAEYLSDALVHLVGLISVSAAVPVLVVLAGLLGDRPAAMTGAALYGATFVTVIGFSALYNVFPHPDWEWLLKRLDHSAIFLKIAGTYSGLSMISGAGTAIVPAVWAVAGLGVALKLVSPHRYRPVALCLYIGLSVLTCLFAERLMVGLPGMTFTLLACGGSLYLVGVCFYLWQRLPFHFTIWHLFVLAGSLCVYAAMVVAVTD